MNSCSVVTEKYYPSCYKECSDAKALENLDHKLLYTLRLQIMYICSFNWGVLKLGYFSTGCYWIQLKQSQINYTYALDLFSLQRDNNKLWKSDKSIFSMSRSLTILTKMIFANIEH